MLNSRLKVMLHPFAKQSIDEGSSLVELLIGLGILTLAVLFISSSLMSSAKLRKTISQSESYQQVDQLLKKSLVDHILAGKCGKVEEFAKSVPLLDGVNLKLLTSAGSLESAPTSGNIEALHRCQNPLSLQNNKYHYCLKVDKLSPAAIKNGTMDPWLGSKDSFIEILAEPFDFQSSSPASCQDLVNGTAYLGLRIMYTLYWNSTSISGIQTNQKSSIYLSLPNS